MSHFDRHIIDGLLDQMAVLTVERDQLRAELAEKTERLRHIKVLLTKNAPRDVYFDEDDDAGDYGCCGERSYEDHAPDCWFMECRALAAKEE